MSARRWTHIPVYAAGLLAAGGLTLLARTQAPAPAPGESAPTGAPAQPGTSDAAPAASPVQPAEPAQTPPPATTVEPPAAATPPVPDQFDDLKRRIRAGEPTVLSFKSASVSELLPLIVEYTGKVVMPTDDILARKITIVNDRPLGRSEALDLVLLALQQRDIAVIETDRIVFLRDKAEVDRQLVPIIPAKESLLERRDVGTVVQKIFPLEHGSAANIGEIVRASLPDSAKLTVDLDSNQVLITGPIALLQRMEMLIASLDKPSASAVVTETFHLKYADADAIAANIKDLFQDQSDPRTQAQRAALSNAIRSSQPGGAGARPQGGQPQGQQGQPQAATASTFKVSSNRQQNAVTVIAEPAIMEKIRNLINEEWDVEVDPDRSKPRVFKLKYLDPIKARDTLEGLFSATTTRTTSFGGFFGGSSSTTSPGATRLAGQFSFQASPETQSIIVVAKSPDNMKIVEDFLAEFDKPREAGIPRIVELKHATAEDLCEQLNALLAQEGTPASVRRVNQDLSPREASALSPFATTFESTDTGFTQTSARQPDTLQFWWQRARLPTSDAGTSTLVGKIRIVPVQRRNAMLVMAPPEYSDAVIELIERLDRPGRQVLIAAIICELSGEDFTALGFRFSSTAINPTNADNTVAVGSGATITGGPPGPNQVFGGVKNNLLPGLFDTSVLNVGVNLNVLLQALAQRTSTRILSEPRIFTGDNQEATFFDGQDIPFITNSEVNTQGNLTQSFDYRAVGINLRVRPRITPERDVDLKVDLELSSIQPGQTLFGGFIVDRRQTTTQLIVKDGQTIVISGIMRTEDSDLKRKVPLLGDIPLIGALFTSIEKTKTNTELVAFITPIVVENPGDSDSINNPQRERLQEMRDVMAPEGKPAAAKAPAEPAEGAAAPKSRTPLADHER
ncbi:MAG: secretin N-terminal domain-containing protein [Phycisphaerales bacterium]